MRKPYLHPDILKDFALAKQMRADDRATKSRASLEADAEFSQLLSMKVSAIRAKQADVTHSLHQMRELQRLRKLTPNEQRKARIILGELRAIKSELAEIEAIANSQHS